jgi:nascent polypeptide-associated complex subunit alpha
MGGRMDPRRMNQMMRQLGIDVKEIEDVREVIIRTPTQEYVFERPEVTIMTAQGQKTYQVVGTPKTTAVAGKSIAESAPAKPQAVTLEITDEDVRLVAQQTGKSPSDARKALEATGGDIAEAIVKLSG